VLAALVESSHDAIFTKDLDGNVQTWNRGAELMYGYAADEIIGRSVSLLVPPGDPDEISGILAKIKHGEPVRHYETVRQTKDGRRLDVSLAVSPLRDATGAVVGASTIARDITAQKRDVERLRESEARLRSTGPMNCSARMSAS
jgi:PAS domain S-box-containing protein